ncbi:hypothetical protein L288_14260 [Sphingobium quisquiliarum P25]|uniref:Uncharacterized protein n=1 Tax=Sphingobium quisquiliarum P25 TaxID=1329909 RepID=T0GWB9_9SPHN|nr:hypothetical protein [Sphingobium quisquiliarum]EQB04238.1 hypothetical protein L288_14260 [Sphingobium quisquiliarum P25]
MVTRRSFLYSAAAAIAARELGIEPALAGDLPAEQQVKIALYDSRFSAARDFGDEAAAHGLRTFGFANDMSRLWRRTLAPTLRERPQAIAGLTHVGALFCLERMAWDLGMRVMLRIEHFEDQGGNCRHIAAAGIPAAMTGLPDAGGASYGRQAAGFAVASRPAWRDCTHAAPARAAGQTGDPLATWVIAPVRRA